LGEREPEAAAVAVGCADQDDDGDRDVYEIWNGATLPERAGDNCTVAMYLDTPGEWVPAAVGLGLAFLVAVLGVSGLGWWVLRGDRLNRTYQETATEQGPGEDHTH
jgi:hypothetical protein